MKQEQTQELAKGFACTKCGKFHAFPAYVFSHWHDLLTHKCDCGMSHDILEGLAAPVFDHKKGEQ